MVAGNVAGVYAEALLAVADARGVRAQVVASCRDLVGEAGTADDALTPALIASLDNPRVGKPHAKNALRQVLGGRVAGEVLDLLLILVDRNRLADAPSILAEAIRQADMRDGAEPLVVTTAVPLSAEAGERIRSRLIEQAHRALAVELRVDPELIGGMTARTPTLFADGSVRRALREMQNRIRSAPLPDSLWNPA